jgi:arylsulfatase
MLMNRFFGIVVCVVCLSSQGIAATPNFLVILADDLGYSDLGCYGGEIETPVLNSLAANGLRFTQFYNTARCWPTRSSLLSGYYAQQINRDALPEASGGAKGVRPSWARLLPEFLKDAGYRSYHSGKWHIDGPVLAGGFDKSLDMRNQGNYFSSEGNNIDDKPDAGSVEEKGYYATIATAEHAIACLQDHAANHSGKPFFHYVAFIAPHFPLHALPEDIAKYHDRYEQGWEATRKSRYQRMVEMGLTKTELSTLEEDVGPPYDFPESIAKLGPGEVNRPLPWSKLTEEQKHFQARKMAIHAAMVDRMDREIGRIIDQLKAMSAFENTVIMFGSDNGASAEIMVRNGGHDPNAPMGSAASYLCLGPGFSSVSNTPHRRHKTWVHEGGISTPWIVHWPAGIKSKNEYRTTPCHVIDLAPTVLDLAGIQKPTSWNGEAIPDAPGKSLVPAFANDAAISRDCLWWLHEGNKAIRVGNWKLVAAKGDPWALYDLTTDRAEQVDLSSQLPDKLKELESVWDAKVAAFTSLSKTEKTDQLERPAKKKRGK